MREKKDRIIPGLWFGALMLCIYAISAQWVNRITLPEIPFAEPPGGMLGYILSYALGGAIIGLVACWPDSMPVGGALGGIVAAVMIFILPWKAALQSQSAFIGTFFLTIFTFLPLAIFLMPFSYTLRASVERLPRQIEGALAPGRIWLPVLTIVLMVFLGSFSIHSEDVQKSFVSMNRMILNGLKAPSEYQLPEPLLDVNGFMQNAQGKYTLEWDENADSFFGPRPATNRGASDYLIVARFENGFVMACVYAPNVKTPNCAVHR
jgi:hypothetical protein